MQFTGEKRRNSAFLNIVTDKLAHIWSTQTSQFVLGHKGKEDRY